MNGWKNVQYLIILPVLIMDLLKYMNLIHQNVSMKIMKIKNFKIFTDNADEEKMLVGNNLDNALEILENNGYIVEVEYEDYD